MTRPRLLFYCQHSLGLGHLARSLLLAGGLAEHFDVVLLNGGRPPRGMRIPAGVSVVDLPALGHDENYRLVAHEAGMSVERAQAIRGRMLLEALAQAAPAVVLIELYPFGRKKFEFELGPLLDAVARSGPHRPRVVCSLRDILVTQRRDQVEHDERAARRVNESFDAVLVHSDPTFARLEESFRPLTPLSVPVHYTGFVAPAARTAPAGSGAVPTDRPLPRLLVSSGGGMVGEPLVRAAVHQHAELAARTGLTTTVVAGPFLPEPVWAWLQDQAAASPALEAVRRVDDLCGEIRRSTLSLSQAGYNTCMDVLRAGTRSVVVPYAEGNENEQSRRATRLADLGLVRVLDSESAAGPALLQALCAALAFEPSPVQLDLGGRERSASLIAELAGLSGARGLAATPEQVGVA